MRTMKGEMDMQNIYRVETRPIALSENVVKGEKYRITMLTEGLIRMEYSEHGVFEDRATQMAFFRDFYNPQNEMFRLLGTKRSFSQNETFFFSHPYPPTLPFSA